MSTVGFKTLTGSFSRYCNEILKDFVQKILPKCVEQWNFYPQIMSTVGFKTLTGSFSRCCNEILAKVQGH